jgi:hypothetical protein
MLGRPPGEYEAGPDDEQEFLAGALHCRGAKWLGPRKRGVQVAVGIAAAVPVGHQPAFDSLLAAHEREAVELDITSKWMLMGARTSVGLDVVIARLDLRLEGPTVPTPVVTRIFFGDVRESGEVLWAAALARRVPVFRESTFRRVVRRTQDTAATGSEIKSILGGGGLEIGNLGGCDALRVGLERAGVKDDIFQGRCA